VTLPPRSSFTRMLGELAPGKWGHFDAGRGAPRAVPETRRLVVVSGVVEDGRGGGEGTRLILRKRNEKKNI